MYVHQKDLKTLLFPLIPGERVFFRGVPGAGKTTFIQELIRNHLGDNTIAIVSPTYTYYQKYGENIYHFDLYRAQNISDIIRIGADEIFEAPESICLIEWPEIIEKTIQPRRIVDITVFGDERHFEITDVKTE